MAKITLPGALGVGAIGAYGYNSAEKYFENTGVSDVLRGFSKALGTGADGASSSGRALPSGGGEGQMKILQGEVDRLHSLLSDVVRGQKGGSGYTVIHTGQKNGLSLVVYPVIGCGLVYLYCRVRGISVSDFFFVSRGSLTAFRSTVTEGFAKIWDEMKRQKDDFVSRLAAVRRGQEQLGETQKAMDERLRQVGDSVDDVRASTYQISSHVQQLDDRMSEVHDGVLRTNQGIMLLCSTVAEVTNRIGMHNSKTSQALKTFVQQPQLPGVANISAAEMAPAGMATPGLRGLIDISPGGTLGSAPPDAGPAVKLPMDATARVVPPSLPSSSSFSLRFFS